MEEMTPQNTSGPWGRACLRGGRMQNREANVTIRWKTHFGYCWTHYFLHFAQSWSLQPAQKRNSKRCNRHQTPLNTILVFARILARLSSAFIAICQSAIDAVDLLQPFKCLVSISSMMNDAGLVSSHHNYLKVAWTLLSNIALQCTLKIDSYIWPHPLPPLSGHFQLHVNLYVVKTGIAHILPFSLILPILLPKPWWCVVHYTTTTSGVESSCRRYKDERKTNTFCGSTFQFLKLRQCKLLFVLLPR